MTVMEATFITLVITVAMVGLALLAAMLYRLPDNTACAYSDDTGCGKCDRDGELSIVLAVVREIEASYGNKNVSLL